MPHRSRLSRPRQSRQLKRPSLLPPPAWRSSAIVARVRRAARARCANSAPPARQRCRVPNQWSSLTARLVQSPPKPMAAGRKTPSHARSEEHTSELQSLRHLVCRLLLEKKKKPPPAAPAVQRNRKINTNTSITDGP